MDRWPLEILLLLQKYGCGNACVWECIYVKMHIGVNMTRCSLCHYIKIMACLGEKYYWMYMHQGILILLC
jgi:hypothetical protein